MFGLNFNEGGVGWGGGGEGMLSWWINQKKSTNQIDFFHHRVSLQSSNLYLKIGKVNENQNVTEYRSKSEKCYTYFLVIILQIEAES